MPKSVDIERAIRPEKEPLLPKEIEKGTSSGGSGSFLTTFLTILQFLLIGGLIFGDYYLKTKIDL